MAEKKGVVFGVVAFLCVAAAALSFAAEGTKIKYLFVVDVFSMFVGASDVIVFETTCIYPNTAANVLGYIAAVLLLIAQITISAVTRCACCQRNARSAGGIVTFVISWVASAIGIVLLIAAANLSTSQEYYSDTGITGHCYVLKTGIFAIGGGLALVACALGLFAYHSSTKHDLQQPAAGAGMPYNNQGGVAMGQPQFNAPSTNPYAYKQQQQYV